VTSLVVGHILFETPKPSNLPEGLLKIFSKVCTLTDTISGHFDWFMAGKRSTI
jgi:hypothetical protein